MGMDLKLITLNINGLNCVKKQELLYNFILENKIHIVNLQEHNLKDSTKLDSVFYDNFHVFISESINLKGGTAILIDKRVTNNIIQIEKSSDARIISVKISIGEKRLHILNIYAPSGNNPQQEREDLFKHHILYYLRNNLSNTILCGDFNCITNVKDKTRNGTCPISKSLQHMIKNLNLKDIWNFKHSQVEFTYFRENYGSRIDRIYAGDLKDKITNIYVKPLSFSDHSSVITEFNLDCNISLGKFYWKLNTKLLELDDIEVEFKYYWDNLCKEKHLHVNLNEWWGNCAKIKIKKFFQKKGREESNFKQGLIRYLEGKLHRLYQTLHDSGILNIEKTKRLKDKINNLKGDILEGVRIRARIKEQVEGEVASSSLLGKQNVNKYKPFISEILTEHNLGGFKENVKLNTQNEISNYITSYHKNMYTAVATDKSKQDWFLSFIEKSITDSDNEELTKFISDEEIFLIIESFSQNKSPGIDGLPIEFYLKFFNIIKLDFCQILRNCLFNNILTDSQRKAVIILLFKGGECNLVSSWRPISLICVDTKILSKIIAKRLETFLDKCISPEQYCGKNKSIVECNNTTRDLMYYISDNNETGALINIDLQRAFDSVDHQFLYKVLKKMGFNDIFVSWIKILYRDIVSIVLVNGHQGDEFNIDRGVRQGCPLSMILYIIAQEPLYQAIKKTHQIRSLEIP